MIPDKVRPLLDRAGAAGWIATEDPEGQVLEGVRLWTLGRADSATEFWLFWAPGPAGGRVWLCRYLQSKDTVDVIAVDLRRAPFTI